MASASAPAPAPVQSDRRNHPPAQGDDTYPPMVDTRGRMYPTTTKLGHEMRMRRLRAYEVAAAARFSPRMLSEYLSGRKRISDKHLVALSLVLGCPGERLRD